LINKIRSAVDDQEQRPRSDCQDGVVRLFVLPGETADKMDAERRVADEMAKETGDPLWSGPAANVKTLILEHHMAARRMGFLDMFQPLYEIDSLQTGLRDGSLPALWLFSEFVSPVVNAKARGDEFATAAIVRKASPLLSKAALIAAGPDQRQQIRKARDAVNELTALCSGNSSPRFLDVLVCICRTGLFEVPECLEPFAGANGNEQDQPGNGSIISAANEAADDQDRAISAWERFLLTSFVQIESYDAYVRGQAPFETHQGVKGREFPRVMVVMDDAEARGFMFSYEKLFGAKEKTKNDLENERERKETGIDRTRRLFYVTCSRAQKSLAIVAYSTHPEKVRNYVVEKGWFESTEVRVLA
jgi:DNA helicase-2/ATP-dependent DNA helicase PcrA